MMYLGDKAVGIANEIPVYDVYQNTAIPNSNSQTITFTNVEHKPDSFVIGLVNRTSTNPPSGYCGCTAAVGFWSEYSGGKYAGGRAGGIYSSDAEDHWGVAAENITYDSSTHTFTLFTNSPVWFINGWTYKLTYYTNHRELTPNA